jgi:exportin-2 (importin alpha re-exporter)
MSGSEENEYIMKAIMRSFSILQEAVMPFLADLLPKLTEILTVISRNPSRPNFNHYLFETLSLSIK